MVTEDERQLVIKTAEYLEALGFKRISTNFRAKVGHSTRIIDLVVHDSNKNILLLAEVKRGLPDKLDQFDAALIHAYALAEAVASPYFLVTDSRKMFWYEIREDDAGNKIRSLESPDEISTEYSLIRTTQAAYLEPENFESIIKDIINTVEENTDLEHDKVFQLVSEIFFAKLIDEKTQDKTLRYEFQVYLNESSSETKSRILSIIERNLDSDQFTEIILKNLHHDLLQNIVRQLQPYRFSKNKDNQRQGEYFNFSDVFNYIGPVLERRLFTPPIPQQICLLMSRMLDLEKGSHFLDPASGYGSLLLAAQKHFLEINEDSSFQELSMIGFNENENIARIARANLLINGVDKFNIIHKDFLDDSTINRQLPKQTNHIVSSLVFRDTLDVTEVPQELLVQLPQFAGKKVDKFVLYLYKAISTLSNNGSASILIPEGFLGSPRYKVFREDLLQKGFLTAIISLPTNTFIPYSRLKSSILLLEKGTRRKNKNSILMIRLNESYSEKSGKKLHLVNEAIEYFRETGKALRAYEDFWDITLVSTSEIKKEFRLDFSFYAPELTRLIQRLKISSPEYAFLGDLAEIKSGRPLKRKDSGNTRVITTKSLEYGLDSEKAFRYVDLDNNQNVVYVEENDILISNFGNSFLLAIIPCNFQDAVIDEKISLISVKDKRVIPEYVFAVLQSEIVQKQLDCLSVGSIIRHIYPKLLGQLVIPILPPDIQGNISQDLRESFEYQARALKKQKAVKEALSHLLDGSESYDS